MTRAIFLFCLALGLFFAGLIALNYALSTTKIMTIKNNKYADYFFIGLFSSMITQSSSAVTSIVVNAVDKDIIKEKLAYFVVMGTNIGTTLICHFVAVNNDFYSLILSILFMTNTIIALMINKEKIKNVFICVSSTLIIIISLRLISDSFLPIIEKLDPVIFLSINPMSLFLLSIISTALFQSSALTATITITLAQNGMLDISYSILMIIGANIGTCSTAIIASLGKSYAAKNTAIFNLMFNLLGAILHINLISFGVYNYFTIMSVSLDTKIALFHTIFNTTTALIFIFGFIISDFIKKKKLSKRKIPI